MIARIAGRVEEVNEASVLVDVGGGVWYEVLVPVCEVERLAKRVGQDVVLYTIHYHEGDPSHGAVTPRLLGFLSPCDRDFFRVFTTVKGVGMRKALRAMARPVGELAAAIQAKDVRFLKALPEIGPKMAERIAVELSGQMDEFAGPPPAAGPELSEAAEEAVLVLVQLGERRPDAIALVERVLAVAPDLTAPEAIIQQAYKLKAGGV